MDNFPIFTASEHIPNPYEPSTNPRWGEIIQNGGWGLSPLYKHNVHGALMLWKVVFDIKTGMMYMIHGQVDGKLQYDPHQIVTNKSTRNLHEQAVLEAHSRYEDKYVKDNYRPAGDAAPIVKDAMSAETWDPEEEDLEYPVGVQPKIDGIRCLVSSNGGKLTYNSRGHNEFTHLNKEFDTELKLLLSKIPYNVIIDGELYVHGLKFEKVVSIIKNEKTLHASIGSLVFCIFTFDTNEPFPFEKRHQILTDAFNALVDDGIIPKRILLLDTRLCNNKEDVLTMYEYYLKLKFEGAMIYRIAGPNPTKTKLNSALYKHSRSRTLLKLKPSVEEEVLVIGVEDSGGREKGAAKLTVKDLKNRYIITLRPSMNLDIRRMWFQNPSLIIGKYVTIKYQELTDKGIPRFPRTKSVRDYE